MGASLSSLGQEPGRSLPSQSLIHQEEREGPGGKKPAHGHAETGFPPQRSCSCGLSPTDNFMLQLPSEEPHRVPEKQGDTCVPGRQDRGCAEVTAAQSWRGQRAPRATRMSAPCLHASRHALPLSPEPRHDRAPDSRGPDTCLSRSCMPSSPSHASLRAL